MWAVHAAVWSCNARPAPLARVRAGQPIFNLLPDLLSRLSADATLDPEAFKSIMRQLIKLILEPDGKAESDAASWSNKLVEKLVARMPDAWAAGPKGARDIAFCLSLLNINDKAPQLAAGPSAMAGQSPALLDQHKCASPLGRG